MPGKLNKRIQNIQRKGHIYTFSQTNLEKQKKKQKTLQINYQTHCTYNTFWIGETK